MISKTAICDAINRELVAAYPDLTVYRDAIPKDFIRPSFYIILGKRKLNDATAETLEIMQPVTVQCIDEVNEHYEADTDRLGAVSDRVEQIFMPGFLRVADRALHIDGIDSARNLDVCDVNLTLHYFDDRPAEGQTAPPPEDGGAQPAAEVVLTTRTEEDK